LFSFLGNREKYLFFYFRGGERQLKDKEPFYPDQKRKPTLSPTTRWVFQTFIDVHVLCIDSLTSVVTNLNTHNRHLLELLGNLYVNVYESS